jgi:hypothetical protein
MDVRFPGLVLALVCVLVAVTIMKDGHVAIMTGHAARRKSICRGNSA